MTLAFIGRAGGDGAGDPPAAWLMPLVGDGVVGVAAVGVALALWRRPGRRTWLAALVFHCLALWDGLSAWLVHASVPWPEFFMIELFGWTMFPAAAGLHGACLALLLTASVRQRTGSLTL